MRKHLFESCQLQLKYTIVDSRLLEPAKLAKNLIQNSQLQQPPFMDFEWLACENFSTVKLQVACQSTQLKGTGSRILDQVRKANEFLRSFDAQLIPSTTLPNQIVSSTNSTVNIHASLATVLTPASVSRRNLTHSLHIQLPFANEDEFNRLYLSVRQIVPILPGLTAQKISDQPLRLADHVYVNKEAGFVEIRMMNLQENPQTDVAIAALIIETLKNMVKESWGSYQALRNWSDTELETILNHVADAPLERTVDSPVYLSSLGIVPSNNNPESIIHMNAMDVWYHLMEQVFSTNSSHLEFTVPLGQVSATN